MRCEFRVTRWVHFVRTSLPRVTSLSDPSRASRGDRRQAQARVDAAFAAGQLTSADHQLRSQRIAAAQTAGDLVGLVRDLPLEASLGSAIDPTVLASMRTGTTTGSGPKPAATIDVSGKARTVRLVIVCVVVGMLLFCGLGIATVVFGTVGAMRGGATDGPHPVRTPPAPTSSPSIGGRATTAATALLTPAGWRSLVTAVETEFRTTSVYQAVVYPDYAVVTVVADGGQRSAVYRDGQFVSAPVVGTAPGTGRIDLAEVDPSVFAQSTYVVIHAVPDGGQVIAYDGSTYRVYALDGTRIR